jgi:hypothetical protein
MIKIAPPPIPSNSLYAYMTAGGGLLFLICLVLPRIQLDATIGERAAIQHELLEAQQSFKDNEAVLADALGPPVKAEKLAYANQYFSDHERPAMLKLADATFRVNMLNGSLVWWSNAAQLIGVPALVAFILGAALWYFRVQAPQDRELSERISNLARRNSSNQIVGGRFSQASVEMHTEN